MVRKNTSFTIGNMFLLTGPATDINEENKENWYQSKSSNLGFQTRSASMSLSCRSFPGQRHGGMFTLKTAQKNSLNSSKKDSPKI